MSITDELREWWVRKFPVMNRELRDELTAIADRIDAEHKRACSEAYGNGVMSVPIALDESAWVKLPVDADGVPIHVGDMVEDAGVREIVERVMQIRYTLTTSGISPTVLTSIITDASQLPQKPNDYRHHHAPTVEDVLTEFGIDWEHESDCEDRAALLAEYAKRLRLADGVDE